MAEEQEDPREVEWHPRRQVDLIGHGEAESRLLQAHQSGKLHHAWLISGPRGIGKATLAYRFAKFLFRVPSAEKARAHSSLYVAPESPSFRQVAAGGHPGLLVIQRAMDEKKKRLKTEIAVDDAREAQGFLGQTAAGGDWRAVIVDAADELNASSANSLLKLIEEPPKQAVFLIVCNRPGQLLRTIRSRCLHMPLQRLDIGETIKVLHNLPAKAVNAGDGDIAQAAQLSRGCPGLAMQMIGSRGAAAFAEFLKRSKLSPATAVEIATAFSGRETAEDYGIFCDLLVGWTAEQARAGGLGGGGDALAAAHDDINSSLRQADALNLDRRQTVTDALMRLEEALKAS